MICSSLWTRWFKTQVAVSLRKKARATKHVKKVKAKEKSESNLVELQLLKTQGVGEDGQKMEHFTINDIDRHTNFFFSSGDAHFYYSIIFAFATFALFYST